MKSYQIDLPHNEILKILESQLIKPDSGIFKVYESLIDYYQIANDITPRLTKQQLMNQLKQAQMHKNDLAEPFRYVKDKINRTIAIDFPVLLKSTAENVKETIIVAAMDPLPPNIEQTQEDKSIIGHWVPFSLIDSEATGEKSFKSNKSFFVSLLQSYNVYVTDIYKIFYREGVYPIDNRSNSDTIYKALEVHKQILNKEIETLKPKAIITLGNNSRNAVLSILNQQILPSWNDVQIYQWDNTPIISIPHISGAANGITSKILKKYPELTGTKSEKLAKLILKYLFSLESD
jgi:hypothetical protein